jgi:WD40 repeat protein
MMEDLPAEGKAGGAPMKLTKLQKWGIAAAVAPVLLIVAFYVHSWLPHYEADPPPATGEVRDVPPSLFDRAISAYYERQTDEPIVAIIRQDIIAQFGAISPDGQYLAIGGSVIRDLCIASIAEKRVVRKFAIRSGNVNAVAYSPDGRYLATGRGFMAHARHNESVNLWDARSGRLIRNLPGPSGPEMVLNDVTALAFSPDGRTLAVSYHHQPNRADAVHIFDVESGNRLRTMHPSTYTYALYFLNGGKHLAYEDDYERSFVVHEVNTGKQVRYYRFDAVYAPSPDGQSLAAGTRKKELKIVDIKTGKELKTLGSARGYHRRLVYSPDGRHLAALSDDGLFIWDVAAGELVRQLKGHPDIMGHWMGFDAAGNYFAAVCNKYVVVWDFKKMVSAKRKN